MTAIMHSSSSLISSRCPQTQQMFLANPFFLFLHEVIDTFHHPLPWFMKISVLHITYNALHSENLKGQKKNLRGLCVGGRVNVKFIIKEIKPRDFVKHYNESWTISDY
jgi:hypothetical protein